MEFRERWIIMVFLALVILTLMAAAQPKMEFLTDKFFTLFDLLETVIDDRPSNESPHKFVGVMGKYLTQSEEAEKGGH